VRPEGVVIRRAGFAHVWRATANGPCGAVCAQAKRNTSQGRNEPAATPRKEITKGVPAESSAQQRVVRARQPTSARAPENPVQGQLIVPPHVRACRLLSSPWPAPHMRRPPSPASVASSLSGLKLSGTCRALLFCCALSRRASETENFVIDS
jgi:hypothetical protein